jgi:valyl-tRNA synthetase
MGVFHLGHGLVSSIIDIVIRFHRMREKSVLWVPGTDHAGIATRHMAEKMFRKSLFKIWNFGVTNAKILPCRLQKSPKTGIFAVY